MTSTEDNLAKRKSLQDMVTGGDGEAPGFVFVLGEPDEHGNCYKTINNEGGWRITCLTKTREEAQKLLDIGKLGI